MANSLADGPRILEFIPNNDGDLPPRAIVVHRSLPRAVERILAVAKQSDDRWRWLVHIIIASEFFLSK